MFDWFRGHKPAWIYESLPFFYAGAGVFTILATRNLMGMFSGGLLIAAGITVNRLRNKYRNYKGKAGLDALVWKNKLESGHAKIDEQHRTLVEKANTLIDAINHKEPNQTINGAMEDLFSSMFVHFRTEEKILEEVARAFIEEHTKVHQQISQKAAELAQGYRDNSVPPNEVASFIKVMIAEHIEKEDSEFFFLTDR
jgi:hemerythrin-like metal-binding protein